MQELEAFLEDWLDISKRDKVKLAEQYSAAFPGKAIDDCPKCAAKAITELRKYLRKQKELAGGSGDIQSLVADETRKYVLIPGNHQFIAGDKIHNNDNITDEIAEFYIRNYPHTKILFAKLP